MKLAVFLGLMAVIFYILFGGAWLIDTLEKKYVEPLGADLILLDPIEIEKFDSILASSSINAEIGKMASKDERVRLKSYAIKKNTVLEKYIATDTRYDIEFVEVNEVEGGVEVLFRAWLNKNPIGFGKDGTVEIERGIIKNPPVLVPDPLGDIVTISPAEYRDGELFVATSTFRYREDPTAALKEVIEHNITLIGKDGANIIAGKVGNTHTTYYPDPDPETTSMDAYAESDGTARSWASTIALTTGTVSDTATIVFGMGYRQQTDTTFRFLDRGIILFDTSDIADTDTVDSATISLYGSTKADQTGHGDDTNIVTSTPASNTSVAAGDFDGFGSTALSTNIAFADWSTSGYNDFVLNATGEAAIDVTGISKFGTKGGYDISGSVPPATAAPPDDIYMRFHSAENTSGTTQAPKLVVQHSSAATTFPEFLLISLLIPWSRVQLYV